MNGVKRLYNQVMNKLIVALSFHLKVNGIECTYGGSNEKTD